MYISSNPATGLVLISPIPTNAALPKTLLPTKLKEFDYEPKFPIAILATPKEMTRFRKESRLGEDPGVDMLTVEDVDSQQAFVEIQKWLDDIGI